MEKRLVAFLMLSTVIMIGWMFVTRALMPPPPVAQQERPEGEEEPAKKEDGQGELAKEDVAPLDAAEPDGGEDEPAVVGPGELPEEAPPAAPDDEPTTSVERQWVTLGSVDPDDPYRMLVTLVNTGAAIERIELSSPRYRDLEDRSGYMGHLGLKALKDKAGLRISVVGAGTPAAKAVCKTSQVGVGLKVGDIILRADDVELNVVKDLENVRMKTRPGQQLALQVQRQVDGQSKTLPFTLTLGKRRLEVVRPELPDIRDKHGRVSEVKKALPRELHPLSFLTTIDEIRAGDDVAKVARGEREINQLPSLHDSNWEVLQDAQQLDAVAFRLVLSDSELKRIGVRGPLEIIKRFRLTKVPQAEQENNAYRAYHLAYDLEIRNLSDVSQIVSYRQQGPTGMPLEGWWFSTKIHPRFGYSAGTRDVIFNLTEGAHRGLNMVGCLQMVKQATKHPDDPNTKLYRQENAAPLRYAGGDTQYFAAVLMPAGKGPERNKYVFPEAVGFPVADIDPVNKKRTDVSYRLTSEARSLEPNQSLRHEFVIFAGPKSPQLLEAYDLSDTLVYGWFWFVAKPMLSLLHFFYSVTFEFSYGIAIIMLTVIVRACMFPLSRKQVMSAQKMQELAPELKRLTEKYKEDMQKKAAAQQELFRKHNYNPLGGCVLVFFQLPIFIGLYRCLSVDIELRQAPLIPGMQWCSNLAAPDQLWHWEHAFPQFFDFLVGLNGFLGPYLNILPLFTIALFLMQQKMFTPPPTDEQQKMQQQVMTFMMIFIGVLFFRVPSGLCLYFIASSLWSLAERKLLPKAKKPEDQPVDPSRAKAQLAAKKAKRKKSRPKR